VQAVVPLVIVIVAEPDPPPLHPPDVVIATAWPELAVAVTLKLELNAALPGAGVPTEIVWPAAVFPDTFRYPVDGVKYVGSI
jgi:hypothetical protein